MCEIAFWISSAFVANMSKGKTIFCFATDCIKFYLQFGDRANYMALCGN